MPNNVAYGFHQLQDIFSQRANEVNVEVITTAIEASAAAHTQDMEALLETLVQPLVGPPKKRVKVGGSSESQPLSQDGTPLPEREGASYEISVPFWRTGSSIGFNREVREKITIGELNEKMLERQRQDAGWMIRRLLASVYTRSEWTYRDDSDDIGTLSIKGLANGDTDSYPDLNGTFAVDDHYSAQAAAIDDVNNPLPAMYSELYEHPFNMEPFVLYAHPTEATAISLLGGFTENPTLNPFIQYGDVTLANGVDDYLGFGNRVMGVCNQFIIVESRRIPAGYPLGVALGGARPVFIREEPEANLRGLQMVPFVKDSNHAGFDFYRKAGFAPYNRVGVVVRRIGNATYAPPSGYDASTLPG
jgi:hypothetical protein